MGDHLQKEIGRRIKEIRKEKRLTQDAMVKYLECGRSNYSRIESGQVMPGGTMLAVLFFKFNVSLDWLFTGQGGKYYDGFFPDFGDYSDDVRRLIKDMAASKAIKHSLLSHYYHYKVQYKSMIEGSGIQGEADEHESGE
jgi:transcriptional regulator with XRE-family HTH domain